jgi:1-acyl-sn-glycerol-3-phosphate acyltransferase
VTTLRACISTAYVVLSTFVGSLLALLFRLFDKSGDLVVDLSHLWSRALLGFAGIELSIEWRAPLDPKGAYVFMANHESTVDIWALLALLPYRVRMIAKKQLARIPLFGWAMWAGRFIFIDRANAVAARRSIEEAKNRIRDGHKVLIYPEGTRTRDGKLGPFKKGGFHLAVDAGVPIVPIAVTGARACMPPGSLLLRRGRVHVVVLEPIATADLGEQDRQLLIDRVRGAIATALGQPAPEVASAAAMPTGVRRELG